jgi:hypothetical protein
MNRVRVAVAAALVAATATCTDPVQAPDCINVITSDCPGAPADTTAPPGTVRWTAVWRVQYTDSTGLHMSCFEDSADDLAASRTTFSLASKDSLTEARAWLRVYQLTATEAWTVVTTGQQWSAQYVTPFFEPVPQGDGALASSHRLLVVYRTDGGAERELDWLLVVRWGPDERPSVRTKLMGWRTVE